MIEKKILCEVKEMFTGKFTKRNEQQQSQIDVSEAHNLWLLLSNRHNIIEHMNLLKNFSHDSDFIYIIQKHVDSYKEESNMLLENLNKYYVPVPTPNAKELDTSGNPQAVNDRGVANTLFMFIKADTTTLINTLRDAHFNDSIRQIFINLLKKNLKTLDKYIIYMKMKGWIDFPPLYPYVKADVQEKVACNEIFQLWDHLIFRYANIRLTELFTSFAADSDFKIILQQGVNTLSKQAIKIEDKLISYGITLPIRYTETIPFIEDTQQLEDKYMFNQLLNGMQNAATIHGSVIQDIIVNDKIRQFFIDLIISELDIINIIVKYGKIKGWLHITPSYRYSY